MDAAWADGEPALAAAIAACWREAEAAEARWHRAVTGARRGPSASGRSAALAWARLNTVAGFPRR